MKPRTVVLLLASIAGIASGPSALNAGAASTPQIEWTDLPLLFLGAAIALFAVLSFQVALKQYNGFKRGWQFFAVATIYALASGASAVLFAMSNSAEGPSMLTILVIGLGMAAGLAALRAAFVTRLQ